MAGVISELVRVRAIDDSSDIASQMVEDAWKLIDKQVPDSFYKLMLRAFGFYVLQRHY